MKWFLIAASQGNANAQNHIGCLYYSGGGVPQDYSKTYEWYLKATEQNSRHAQDNLGGLYRHGKGVVQDFSKAMEWYVKAADQGDSTALFSIGFNVLQRSRRGSVLFQVNGVVC